MSQHKLSPEHITDFERFFDDVISKLYTIMDITDLHTASIPELGIYIRRVKHGDRTVIRPRVDHGRYKPIKEDNE